MEKLICQSNWYTCRSWVFFWQNVGPPGVGAGQEWWVPRNPSPGRVPLGGWGIYLKILKNARKYGVTSILMKTFPLNVFPFNLPVWTLIFIEVSIFCKYSTTFFQKAFKYRFKFFWPVFFFRSFEFCLLFFVFFLLVVFVSFFHFLVDWSKIVCIVQNPPPQLKRGCVYSGPPLPKQRGCIFIWTLLFWFLLTFLRITIKIGVRL